MEGIQLFIKVTKVIPKNQEKRDFGITLCGVPLGRSLLQSTGPCVTAPVAPPEGWPWQMEFLTAVVTYHLTTGSFI